MSALFSALVARAIVTLCSIIVAGAGFSEATPRGARATVVALSLSSVRDTTAAPSKPDTNQKTPAPKPAPPDKPAQPEKPQQGVRISITDEAIRIEGESGTERIKLEVDADRLGERIKEAIAGINEDGTLEALRGLPESLLVFLRDDDDRTYSRVISGQSVRIGKNTHIRRNELVQSDVVSIGGRVRIEGTVRGDVVSIGGRVLIEGAVRGDVVSVLGDTELAGTAVVNGDVVTVLGNLIERDGARVRGERVAVAAGSPIQLSLPFIAAGESAVKAALKTAQFIILALLIMLVVAFLPDRMRRSSDHVFGAFFKSLGVGALVILLGTLAVAIMVVILSITIIGIPIAVLLALSYAALLVLGYFVGALALGRLICRRFGFCGDSAVLHGMFGIFLLSVFGLLASLMWINPFLLPARAMLTTLGGFLGFIAVLTGTGALIISRVGMRPVESRPAIPPTMEQ